MELTKIKKDMFIVDLGLYLKKENTLVLADVHLGYEESLNKRGVLIPRKQFEELIDRVENIFSLLPQKLDRIVINGDLKHEFGRISSQEWKDVGKFIELCKKRAREVVVIVGNHDPILPPLLKKHDVVGVSYLVLGEALILHGDVLPEKLGVGVAEGEGGKGMSSFSTLIIGHEHPAVGLMDENRIETFKCFLLGKYSGCDLIVQPSLFSLQEGTDVLRHKKLSPFLQDEKKLMKFSCFVVGDDIYPFGKLKDLL